MKGTFYVTGVGPGDPQLITLKALHVIREADVLAVPVSGADLSEAVYEEEAPYKVPEHILEECVAYGIVRQVLPEIETRRKLYLPMPMKKEKSILKKIHDQGAQMAAELLDAGKSIAFITLRDPTVYSTGVYIYERLKKQGYETILVPGVPSFCAAAARLDIPLVRNCEELHIIPASYGAEEGLKLPGTKVLMKAGAKLPKVRQYAKEMGMRIQMVERCGMKEEKIYRSAEEIPDDAGYFSLLIVKEEE